MERLQATFAFAREQFDRVERNGCTVTEEELKAICQHHGRAPISAERLAEMYVGQYARQLERHAVAVV